MSEEMIVPDWFKKAYRVRQLTSVAFLLVAGLFLSVAVVFASQPNWFAAAVAFCASAAAILMMKGFVLNLYHVEQADDTMLALTKGRRLRQIDMANVKGYFTFPIGYEVHFNIAVVLKNWRIVIIPNHPSHKLLDVLERNGKHRLKGL